MLFKIVLFAVIAYLAACYAYGLYLLWKLYCGRKFQDDGGLGEHPAPGTAPATASAAPAVPAARTAPAYDDRPAKAA